MLLSWHSSLERKVLGRDRTQWAANGPGGRQMTARRDVAAEVLGGLREVREYREGKRTLKTSRVKPGLPSELVPDAIRRVSHDLNLHMKKSS